MNIKTKIIINTSALILTVMALIFVIGALVLEMGKTNNSATAGTVIHDSPARANVAFNENLDNVYGTDAIPIDTVEVIQPMDTVEVLQPMFEPSRGTCFLVPLRKKYRKLELLRLRKEYDQQKEQEKIDKLRIQIKEELLQYLKGCPPMIFNVEIEKDKILIIIIEEEPERAIEISLNGDYPIEKFSSWSILLIQSKMPEIKKEIERQIDEEIKELEKE
ncbi:MAG: hypothetical protein PHW73_10360 [Atribacterota bacterium]|nr:hypothetical protein [Atribacterota bacterium]